MKKLAILLLIIGISFVVIFVFKINNKDTDIIKYNKKDFIELNDETQKIKIFFPIFDDYSIGNEIEKDNKVYFKNNNNNEYISALFIKLDLDTYVSTLNTSFSTEDIYLQYNEEFIEKNTDNCIIRYTYIMSNGNISGESIVYIGKISDNLTFAVIYNLTSRKMDNLEIKSVKAAINKG